MEETPFQDRIVPRVEIDWDRSLWWWYPLTRALHPAVRWTSLLVGLLGLYLIQLGLRLAETWFAPAFETRLHFGWTGTAWLSWPGWEMSGGFPDLTANNLAYFSFIALWLGLVSGTLGGILARRAAVEVGRRNIASWSEAIRIAGRRLGSSLWAAGMYLVGLVALGIPIMILGWFSKWGAPAAAIAGFVLVTLAIPLMFATGRMLVSFFLCFPLSICAIHIEKKADAFEGFSRSNAYLFQRPAASGLLIAAFALLGSIGFFIVYWTVQLGWGLISTLFLSAAGQNQNAAPWVATGSGLASRLAAAFQFSYFWSAAGALYLILRRAVDQTEMDEIDMLDSELERELPRIPGESQSAAPAATATGGATSDDAQSLTSVP